MTPAALLSVAVTAAANVITSQQQQNSNGPQITLPPALSTANAHTMLKSRCRSPAPTTPPVGRWNSAGNLYITDYIRVLKLAAGSATQTVPRSNESPTSNSNARNAVASP
jgi:hypothetical protein